MERKTSIDRRSTRMLVSIGGAIIAPFVVLQVYITYADRMHVFLDLPTDTPVYLLAIAIGVAFIAIMPGTILARVITAVIYLPIIVVLTFMFALTLVCGLGVGRCL